MGNTPGKGVKWFEESTYLLRRLIRGATDCATEMHVEVSEFSGELCHEVSDAATSVSSAQRSAAWGHWNFCRLQVPVGFPAVCGFRTLSREGGCAGRVTAIVGVLVWEGTAITFF